MTDPLEDELAALRPRAVSPELHRGVAESLKVQPARRWTWGLAVVGVLTTIGVILSLQGKKDRAPPTPPVVVPAPTVPVESPDPAPSVLAYQRALARSPDDLSALLDKHAAAPGPSPAAITWSNATLDALIGDD